MSTEQDPAAANAPNRRRRAGGAGRRAALREVAYLTGMLVTSGLAFWVLVLLPSRLQTEELRRKHERSLAEVEHLQQETARLERETRALEDDPWAVERALRARLGFLRPGERVLR